MRFRPKRAIKIFIFFVVLFVYINFFEVITTTFSIGGHDPLHQESNQIHPEVVREFTTEAPQTIDQTDIYPSKEYAHTDRILEQLKFIPASVRAKQKEDREPEIPLKTILLASGIGGWAVRRGQATFKDQKCAVQHCLISSNRTKMKEADVVLFNGLAKAADSKARHQIWVLNMLESPYHTPNLMAYKDKFNWTATYRHDSTIVAPYERFVPFNASVRTKPQSRNYATGKTKMVAWFVSNCGARNNRKKYAMELSKFIQVDIYGNCGTLKCPRHQSDKCFGMLNKDYRFYLAFENSNCRDYITEKFFVNGLKHDVIPVVMGGAPEDYERVAPPHSFIHVDNFKSPKELSDYLHLLASDDRLYNQYFQWKGTGRLINTYFWCRMCALAHDVDRRGPSWYQDVNTWWRGGPTCIGTKSWREVHNRTMLIGPLATDGRQTDSS